jgi:uncharacterized protein YacL
MFKQLLNFEGINWWTLLGGLGLNFIITILVGLLSIYLQATSPEGGFFAMFGAPIMVLIFFLACTLGGFIVGKVAGDEPVKHALWSSLGAVVPLLVASVMMMNLNTLMFPIIALAGAVNGGMLAMPRRRYSPPQDRER